MSDFYVFGPFLAEKMALEVKKARFNPFVLPSDFFKSDGDPVYALPCSKQKNSSPNIPVKTLSPRVTRSFGSALYQMCSRLTWTKYFAETFLIFFLCWPP